MFKAKRRVIVTIIALCIGLLAPCKITNADETDSLKLLATVVMAEAENQSIGGKRLVVDVVLNRMTSDNFPDTIKEVLRQNGQFEVFQNGRFDSVKNRVTDECFKAVDMELCGRLDYNILYFSRGRMKYANNHFKYQDHWFGW